jgi:hypothetical protein
VTFETLPSFGPGIHPHTDAHLRYRKYAVSSTVNGDRSGVPLEDIRPLLSCMLLTNEHALLRWAAIAHDTS